MACGVMGNQAVNRTCSLNASDKVSLLHRSWADGAQPGSIDPSHKGSTAIYMKKMADATSTDPWSTEAAGDGWFKIAYTGFDDAASEWGTEEMIANKGLLEVQIPADIASGYYLVRSEALALQNVVNEHVNPQFYVGCAQVFVQGTGTVEPTSTVAIPGYVSTTDSAMSYNIYKNTPPTVPFQEFGPQVHVASSSGSASSSDTSTSSSAVGACPSDTVLQVANQCLTEIESWSDDTAGALPKCWAASQACWDKLDTCWNNTSPAVNSADQDVGCNLWNERCLGIVNWCEAGPNLEGPPDAGKMLTPTPATLSRRLRRGRARRAVA